MTRVSEEMVVSGARIENKAVGKTGGSFCGLPNTYDLKFATHYHPYVCEFMKALNRKGIPGLLTLENQQLSEPPPALHTMFDALVHEAVTRLSGLFEYEYSPNDGVVEKPYPKEEVDFTYDQAYSLYNWELFFHIPLLIATRLSKNQKFEEAQQWFHYIFNPTDSSPDPPPQRYWKVLPFYQNTESGRIEDLLRQLHDAGSSSQSSQCKQDVPTQIEEWRKNPFNPHSIARMRLIAYQKTVVMKYIDNLIAWGDQLFSQDTMESVNEATQVYVLAYDMLGPRPERVPSRGTVQEHTYNDLVKLGLDDFSNALVDLENEFPFGSTSVTKNGDDSGASGGLGLGRTFYFCIPQNDKLLGYWDTVADRLFKIRHCMNIEGVVRQLPLFAPPIDPALLVQAAAAGVDISSVLNDLNAATPHYRFTYMVQKALELSAEVRSLGAALLAALEKKDSEVLAALRASQETSLLKAVRVVKEHQIEEARDTLEGLNKYQDVVNARLQYYQQIIRISDREQSNIQNLGIAHTLNEIAQGIRASVAVAHLIPNFDLGTAGWASSPTVTATFGGNNIGSAIEATAEVLNAIAAQYTHDASMASIMAGYDRRWDEWKQQEKLANKELKQIDKQIAAATVRTAIVQLELDNHDKQIENASAVEDFLRDKYTNQELYDWMVGQTSAIFFQCYQMAYDVAKRVEKAFRFERGLTTSNYIQFGYWDSLRKGLLSGERLYLDLKRLEMAYLDQNKRDYEITKHISLVVLNPMALIALKETGQCIVDLPEPLFDADYPGHYMRRIKSISLTIPCVTGPYTSVNCTLTLLKSSIRLNSNIAGSEGNNYTRDVNSDDPRFADNFSAVESIATSHAQNDTGMFELNFRDERYLPFEGAGAISTWRIDMAKDTNAFDFETISDVVINLNYTARDGGQTLQQATRDEKIKQLQEGITALRLFSLKHEFPSDWYRFLHPPDTAPSQTMTLALTMERFPFQFRGRSIQIQQVELFLKFKDIHDPKAYALDKNNHTPLGDYAQGIIALGKAPLMLYVTPPGDPPNACSATLPSEPSFLYGIPHGPVDFTKQPRSLGAWLLEARDADVGQIAGSLCATVTANSTAHYRLKPDVIEDIVMVCHYSVSAGG